MYLCMYTFEQGLPPLFPAQIKKRHIFWVKVTWPFFCLFGLECAFVHSFWDRDQPILLSFPNVPSFVIEIHFLLWTLMDLYPVMSFEPTSRLIHSIILGSVEPT